MKFGCAYICNQGVNRFHLTCFWCIIRKIYYLKVNPNFYEPTKYKNLILPINRHIEIINLDNQGNTYFLIVDDNRTLFYVKNKALDYWLKLCVRFKTYPKILKKCLTVAEGLSNI